MIELLEAAALRAPDSAAVLRGAQRTTYAELADAARRVAAGLRDAGITRVAVLDPDPMTVAAVLAGASAIGVETCVYPPTANDELVAELAKRFDHEWLVSPREVDAPLTVLTPDELLRNEPAELGPAPEKRPHLVLTTGTTGHPRAARHEWSRLLRPFEGARPTPDQRWLLAYGLNQFGGLQVLVHAISTGSTVVATETFVPRSGLEAMIEHGVTHASATPTYWRFVLAELAATGGPAPTLRQITLGGEAVPAELLDRLEEAFPDARITQIYGATEFGNISVRDRANGLPLAELSTQKNVELRVEDGQLWSRSKVGMLGYYGEDPLDLDAWRPTGDLVEVVGDRVMFRGRESEVINVGGVKVHPLPVEERVSRLPAVQMVRVFGRRSALTGSIVAVEVIPSPNADRDELDAQIREACADLPPAAQPRSIRFVETMATTGNKLSRSTN